MNIQRMQSILAGRGIRITPDDPIYALLALNEVVLSEMTKQHLKALQAGGGQIIVPDRLGVQHFQAALEKNGIAIQSNDPLFSLLLLNEDVLNESTKKARSAYKVAELRPTVASKKHVGVMLAAGMFLIGIVTAVALLGKTTGLLIGVVGSSLCGLGSGFALSKILQQKSEAETNDVRKVAEAACWNEREFVVATSKIKMSQRTLDAARDVLIMGLEIQEAAFKHKVESLNLNRAVQQIKGVLPN